MEEDIKIESSNINFKWLDYIYGQLTKIQEMQILSREGCTSLMEYMEIPFNLRLVILPEIQYKNLRFFVDELDMLIDNLQPILKEKIDKYEKNIKIVRSILDKRELFLKEFKKDNVVYQINLLDIFFKTLNFVIEIKADIIKDIGYILYIEDKEKSKTW